MVKMIRKQIYIGPAHEARLKRLARLRKTSEATLIREAIDRQLTIALPPSLDPEASKEGAPCWHWIRCVPPR